MEEEGIILSSLLTLNTCQLFDMTHSLWSDSVFQHGRLCFLLLSPSLFVQTLHYIESLSLHHKTLLIARLLLRSLQKLTQIWAEKSIQPCIGTESLQDFDAGLLLLALCQVSEADHRKLAYGSDWRAEVTENVLSNLLTPTGLGFQGWAVLGPYVDKAIKCRRFLEAVTGGECNEEGPGRSATSAERMVSVNLVVSIEGKECLICREELAEGKEVYELPCQHVFHWVCILPWLKKANTCPSCRLELPSDDVFGEIEWLWKVLLGKSMRNAG